MQPNIAFGPRCDGYTAWSVHGWRREGLAPMSTDTRVVLVGFDATRTSDRVLWAGRDLAERTHSHLLVVHVTPHVPLYADLGLLIDDNDLSRALGPGVFADVVELLSGVDTSWGFVCRSGDVAVVLAELAREQSASV